MSPKALLICGPPGTGKTSHTKIMFENAGLSIDDFVDIDPDKRKEVHSSDRSRLALEEVLETIDKGQSFYYTATCGGMRILNDLIAKMKAKHYRIVIAISYVSLPTALERIRKRTHQPVPQKVIEDLHAFFKTKAERFMKLPVELYLYNNETDFNLLLSKKHKKIVCLDGDFYFDISRYCS